MNTKKLTKNVTEYITNTDFCNKTQDDIYSDVLQIVRINSTKRRIRNAAKRAAKEIVKGLAMAGTPYSMQHNS